MSVLVNKPAPDFKATAVVNGSDFAEVSLSDYKGKKVLLSSTHLTSHSYAQLSFTLSKQKLKNSKRETLKL